MVALTRVSCCRSRYMGCLRADVDLGKCRFVGQSPEVVRSIWADTREKLEAARAEAVNSRMDSSKDGGIDDVDRGRVCKFELLCDSSLLIERKLFGCDLDSTEWDSMVEAQARAGVVSAVAVAWNIAVDSFFCTFKKGNSTRLMPLLLISTALAFITPITRLVLGREHVMGEPGWGQVIFFLLFIVKMSTFWLVLLYVAYPAYDGLGRLKISQRLSDLVGDGMLATARETSTTAADTNPLSVESFQRDLEDGVDGGAVSSSLLQPSTTMLNLDMRLPDNVVAWSCLRKSLGCGELGKSFYVKYNCYNAIIFVSTIMLMFFFSLAAKMTGEIDVAIALDIVVRVVLTLSAIIVQVFVGWKTNFASSLQKEQLIQEKISIQVRPEFVGGSCLRMSH